MLLKFISLGTINNKSAILHNSFESIITWTIVDLSSKVFCHRNGNFIGVTALVFAGDFEACCGVSSEYQSCHPYDLSRF